MAWEWKNKFIGQRQHHIGTCETKIGKNIGVLKIVF